MFDRADLRRLARAKRQPNEYVSVSRGQLDEMAAKGWLPVREGKRRVRLGRPKSHSMLLEDRVWSVLYSLGFARLSGPLGASIVGADPKLTNQLDVVVTDDEVGLAVECKSSAALSRR